MRRYAPLRFPRPWAVGVAIVVILGGGAAWGGGFREPPRYDGAGYAVLAEALRTGRGYREIDHPDAPRHDHFPPGYPAALAAVWTLTGRSVPAAHGFSLACTALAALAAWRWFRLLLPPRSADLLGLALAANWAWQRVGASIQSEPLYLLLASATLLAATRLARRGGAGALGGVGLGVALAACVLTRHAGAALAGAVGLDLLARRKTAAALAAGLTAAALVAPWAGWLAAVRRHPQASLVAGGGAAGAAARGAFYARRLPDAVTGPFVEVATVFRPSGPVSWAADAWAAAASALVALGWLRAARSPRRRLAAWAPLATLALLLAWPFTEAGRFLVPLIPCVLVGACEGLAPLLARPAGLRRARVLAAGLVLAASLPYPAYALLAGRAAAQRRTQADFDAACARLAPGGPAARPGAVMTRHPGEVFWQTGRLAVAPPDAPERVAEAVARHGVAYLLVDDARFANAPPSPLSAFVASHPGRAREVWTSRSGRSAVTIYEVSPGPR